MTSGIKYTNVSNLWRYTTKTTDSTGITVSGRLQGWYDPDGSASQLGTRAMIGSSWANDWWKYNSNCNLHLEAWRCPLNAGDSVASLTFKHNPSQEAGIGSSVCINGGGSKPCPIVAQVTHFGRTEVSGLSVGVNAKVTGPIIASAGGWFARFSAGTPKELTISYVQGRIFNIPYNILLQIVSLYMFIVNLKCMIANSYIIVCVLNPISVKENDVLLLAIPYPAGTTFNIRHAAAGWCGSWTTCSHTVRAVSSVDQVRSAFGDAYYWNNAQRILYIRPVQSNSTFDNDPAVWYPRPPAEIFARGRRE